MEDVAEVIRSAAENLTTWLDGVAGSGPHEARVFDALDACTVATALIEAGLNPRNSKTISPIKGVLRLGADRLAEITEAEGRRGREAIRAMSIDNVTPIRSRAPWPKGTSRIGTADAGRAGNC